MLQAAMESFCEGRELCRLKRQCQKRHQNPNVDLILSRASRPFGCISKPKRSKS
jgi:hypothetical protein